MCVSDNFLFLAHKTGLAKFSLAASVTCENILRNNSQECKAIHSVAPLPNGRIAFTDQDSRQVKLLARGGDVVVIAGTGVESNRNGSGSHASFGQPMGLCTEGPNIFVTDGQIGTVKLVTTIRGTVEFLEHLGKFYRAFSVHLKHQPREKYTIQEAHQMVKDVSAYVKSGTVSEVQAVLNSDRTPNGPDGAVASKTAKSIALVEKGLEELHNNLNEVNSDFELNPEVCLTLQVENFHAVSHFKHPTVPF